MSFTDNTLSIVVSENPIIENIKYEGLKKKKVLDLVKENSFLKSRLSYNENLLKKEKDRLQILLKNLGYYNSVLEIYVDNERNNLVDITLKFNLCNKSKIKKISFIGNKIYKDKKLRRIIASSEYKYWKILSGRKFLNENVVELDERLLKNFYKNNGYYNAKINSSFAKLINNNEFELIFNIDAKSKIFDQLSLDIPADFDENNFKKINKIFLKLKESLILLIQLIIY